MDTALLEVTAGRILRKSIWPDSKMAKFVLPEHSRSAVNRAGNVIRDGATSHRSLDHALEIINNWRASHRYPMHVIYMLLKNRARHVDVNAVVSQRLKRLPSIQKKLGRRQTSTMNLAQMQDIGGCRAVVRDMAAVDDLIKQFEVGFAKNPLRHPRVGELRDYITHPKDDGYRSAHYVLQYRTSSPTKAEYDGHRIEIQIRTKMQHAWATALETVDMLTEQGLKFALNEDNVGDPAWKRFFCLMGTAIAHREKKAGVPGTPENFDDVVYQLEQLGAELRISDILAGVAAADQYVGREKGTVAVLLILRLKERTMSVERFNTENIASIDSRYLELEKIDDPNVQVVQVFMDDMNALRQAYPNFYLDTHAFLKVYRETVGGSIVARPRSRGQGRS